jgi:hypothetical protein
LFVILFPYYWHIAPFSFEKFVLVVNPELLEYADGTHVLASPKDDTAASFSGYWNLTFLELKFNCSVHL